MKAICLFLCLALAQGHIVRRNRHSKIMDRLNVQPSEYYNQDYKEQQKAPQAFRSVIDREEHINPTVYNSESQSDEQYPFQWATRLPQSEYETKSAEPMRVPIRWATKSLNKGLDAQSQVQVRFPIMWATRSPQKQYEQTQQQREVSREYNTDKYSWQPQLINENAMPVYSDVDTLSHRLYKDQADMQPAYGDAISWKGIQFAASPKYGDVLKEDIEKIFSEAEKTMTHLSKERKETFHQVFEDVAKKVNEESLLNATQMLNENHYPVETHEIKTDDGYFLTLFRIAPKDETLVQRPVVFLMHGLLGSADDWLLMGPSKSLAYMLSDAGYEVWLGNARGSKYSRRHVTKHPAQADFWQYSTDEIALHDLPAMIDYVLKTAQQEKMYYIGYSQGTTTFFALAAARPEYNNKIIMMYALSPMVYMSEVRSPLFRMIAPTSAFYERLYEQLGNDEFRPSKELVHTLGGSMCENNIGCKKICSNVNFVMAGVNVDNLEVEKIPVIMAHLPAGGSTRQMRQYAQAVASHEFTRFDYGPMINRKVYGSVDPPRYDMSKVEAPVALYYSEEDWLASPRDVERLVQELPNVKDTYKVANFSHMDFQFSKNVSEMLNKRIIDSIKLNSQQNNVY